MSNRKTPMEVIRGGGDLAGPIASSIVTIGNFDGVHLAHQDLMRSVVQSARQANAKAAAVTFDPHPAQILTPSRAPEVLTPLDTKIALIASQGIDLLWILPFTEAVARLTPVEFVQSVLIDRLRAAEVHVGSNFCFGRGRQGNAEVLAKLGREHGFRVKTLPLFKVRGQRVSSSRIRELLAEGNVRIANRLLGRPYSAEGPIIPGEGVGRKQTVPTLNLGPVQQQLPARGVYVARTRFGGKAWDSAVNVGHKPTFGPHPLTVESHLLNFQGEIAATRMEIEFLYRLREERKFADPAALKAQILKDARRSLKYFSLWDRARGSWSAPEAPLKGPR